MSKERQNSKARFSIYKGKEKKERKTRDRVSKTTAVASLSLEEIKRYYEDQALPEQGRFAMRALVKISREWKEICGDLLHQYLQPVSLYGYTLVVEANSGLFYTQAHLIEKDMRERIEERIPGLKINKIQFKVGQVSQVNTPNAPDKEPKPDTLEEQMEWLERIAKLRDELKD